MEADQYLEDYKQIEDIIDARKKLGHYNVRNENTRFSTPNVEQITNNSHVDRYVRFDDSVFQNDDTVSNPKLTDSEVTIVNVKCGVFKRSLSKWDMHDVAIPGDGSHLGESPSLVNLATMVIQIPALNISSTKGSEYLVPLSSWDPYYCKFEDRKSELSDSESNIESVEKDSLNSRENSYRHLGLTNKLIKFIQKRCKKSKRYP